jgi:lysophospholipase L1-like esterase
VLGLAECAGRVAGAPPEGPALVLEDTGERWPAFTRPGPALGWRQEPGISSMDPVWTQWDRRFALGRPSDGAVHTNARGWRDDPVPAQKPAGERWVLALGDSSVWGSGCPPEERFSERLEATLAPRSVEVWNAAVPGYSSWHARTVLDESADLPLDGVLIYNMVSDMGDARGVPDDLWFSSPARQRGTAVLLNSRLYGWLRFWVFRLRAAQRLDRDPEMKLRVHVSQYADNLRTLAETARARGMFVVGVIPPLRLDIEPGLPPYVPGDAAGRTEMRARLAELAGRPSAEAGPVDYRMAMVLTFRELGVPVVDGPAALTAAHAAEPGRFAGADQLFVDPVHPSSEGHRLLSEAIAPVLARVLDGGSGWQNGAAPEPP